MPRLPISIGAYALGAITIALLVPSGTFAGDADFEGVDDHENGAPFFGEAKDVNGLKLIDGVTVNLRLRDEGGSWIIANIDTDAEGKFKIRGFGKMVDPDTVLVSCAKEGYRSVDVMRRRMSGAADAPVEIECLLDRQ